MATRSMPFWPRPATTSGSSWPGSGLCAPFSGRLSWSGITRAAPPPHPLARPNSLFHRRPAVRFEHALQAARGFGAGTADASLAQDAVRDLDRAKWCLWHGRWTGCRRKLASWRRWTRRKYVRDVAGIGRLQRHVSDLLGYLERNQGALVHYAARRRRGEPISTAFVES